MVPISPIASISVIEKLSGQIIPSASISLPWPANISAASATNAEVLSTLKRTADIIWKRNWKDYWLSDAGQEELLQKIDERSKKPSGNGLSPLDYTKATKNAMLNLAGAAGDQGE